MNQFDETNKDIVLEPGKYPIESSAEDSIDEEVSCLGTLERIKYLFTKPSKTMKDLARRPRVIFPIFVIVLGLLITEIMKINLSNSYQTIAEIQEPALRYITLGAVMLLPVLIGPMSLILWFGKVLFVHGLAGVLGGEGSFKGVTSVIGFAYIINVLGEFVRMIVALITGNILVSISLIALFPRVEEGTRLYALMHQLNIFTIIYLAVATIGIAYVHKISKLKASIAVFGSWIGYIVLILLLAGI